MKLFQKKPKDERIVSEVNKTYKAAWYVMSVGFIIDLYQKMAGGTPEGISTFRYVGLEVLIFLAAAVLQIVLLVRGGLMDDNPVYAETDRFPLRHYLGISAAAGACAGVLYCVCSLLFGADYFKSAFVIAICFAGIFVCVLIGCLIAFFVTWRAAKKRRAAQLAQAEED